LHSSIDHIIIRPALPIDIEKFEACRYVVSINALVNGHVSIAVLLVTLKRNGVLVSQMPKKVATVLAA
jgi:hypothetical protein